MYWWEVKDSKGESLTLLDKAVFLIMLNTCCAKKHKITWIGKPAIAELLGCHVGSVKRCMRRLRRLGLIDEATPIGDNRYSRTLFVNGSGVFTGQGQHMIELQAVISDYEKSQQSEDMNRYDYS